MATDLKAHGQIRRGQVVTTWGPGALIDLPRHAAIVGGLDHWPHTDELERVDEPRLIRKLELDTGKSNLALYAPPIPNDDPRAPRRGITVWQFPEWFVVNESDAPNDSATARSRRLVHRHSLDDKGRFEGRPVVPTRFVCACRRGHVDDLRWLFFAHRGDPCPGSRQLWLDEVGVGGDLADLFVRCECGARRGLVEAVDMASKALGPCTGARPWLGAGESVECREPFRLLIRTATNAYFPSVFTVLSIPEHVSPIDQAVAPHVDKLKVYTTVEQLAVVRMMAPFDSALAGFGDAEVLEAVRKLSAAPVAERSVKPVELDAILAAPEGYADDVPEGATFHARRLPPHIWRPATGAADSPLDPVEAVIQLHRLREVMALTGFTRFEPIMPDINGELETDVTLAELAAEPTWYPAVENHGEGLFVQLRGDAVAAWLARPAVQERLGQLRGGHEQWQASRKSERPFPEGPYILLHTLSHLLLQSLAMRCGYPASAVRERVYVDKELGRYGLLLYTGSPDAEGTLGGLVQQARSIELHLANALRLGRLCSNDPICAQHEPKSTMEGRWLHGAACHGCTLVAEPSCEMRNDYLDRALVVPTLATPSAAFFR